jgi:acetyltransferase
VLTNAGGPGVTAADALEVNGMNLAQLGQDTRKALSDLLPPAASLQNPVDMLASASPQQYAQCLAALLDDPGVDGVMVILPPPPMFTAGAVAKALIPVIHNSDKPIVIALMGERLIQEAVEHFRAAYVPEYRFPERAASALAVLAQHAEYLARVAHAPEPDSQMDTEGARDILETYLTQTGPAPGAFLPQEIVENMLAAYGIPVQPVELAQSAQQAADLARRMGLPAALKVASPHIPHKSDGKGVLLDLRDEQTVSRGFDQIIANARAVHPEAEILGVFVQPMIAEGQDVIVGGVQDPHFGPLVMFGSGGVEVEGLKDVAFALAPMTGEEAEHLLESTWGGRKLHGYRSLPPADRQAVKNVLQRLAQLAADFPQLAEIEINPLRVLPQGKGAYALDVRASLSG